MKDTPWMCPMCRAIYDTTDNTGPTSLCIHTTGGVKPIIVINGKFYVADNPKLKTIHKEGEVVIGGFRELK